MSIADHPVILTYHSISEGRSPLRTSPQLFQEQMEWLKRNTCVVPLAEVVAALKEKGPLRPRRVAITFDDGFQDLYTQAAPVLRQLKLPVIVFLATGYCGRTNAWPGQPEWVDELPLLNWEQIRELAAQGVSFGAHTVTHPSLTELQISQAEREIAESKKHIEKATGRSAELFCYPYGRWNSSVQEIAKRYFRGACSTAAGVVKPGADPFALPRVDAHYVRHPAWYRLVFTHRFQTYLAARRLVRRLRRQPEGYYPRV
jgi:peptidoglycan/xylan/chitin deacetylase (PgdA/CDA1 family)